MENIRVSCVHSVARCEGLPSDGKSSPWISQNLAKLKNHLPIVSVIRHPFFPSETNLSGIFEHRQFSAAIVAKRFENQQREKRHYEKILRTIQRILATL